MERNVRVHLCPDSVKKAQLYRQLILKLAEQHTGMQSCALICWSVSITQYMRCGRCLYGRSIGAMLHLYRTMRGCSSSCLEA